MSSSSSSDSSEGETFHVERRRGWAAWVCNLLWILSGSFFPALLWFALALLLCISIVGIPFGVQCYKMGKLALLPFGYKVVDKGGILCCGIDWLCNCIWWIPGLLIAAFEVICAVISFISIIGFQNRVRLLVKVVGHASNSSCIFHMAEAFKVEDRRGCGHWTCNVLWILSGGWVAALWWLLFACIFCITIIGIPCGIQCFKMAKLSFIPFGYRVEDKGSSPCCACHCLGNCLWFIPGLIIAIFNIISAILCFISIIGIPFGIQYCKLARLAFSPFGLEVTADKVVAVEVVNV